MKLFPMDKPAVAIGQAVAISAAVGAGVYVGLRVKKYLEGRKQTQGQPSSGEPTPKENTIADVRIEDVKYIDSGTSMTVYIPMTKTPPTVDDLIAVAKGFVMSVHADAYGLTAQKMPASAMRGYYQVDVQYSTYGNTAASAGGGGGGYAGQGQATDYTQQQVSVAQPPPTQTPTQITQQQATDYAVSPKSTNTFLKPLTLTLTKEKAMSFLT